MRSGICTPWFRIGRHEDAPTVPVTPPEGGEPTGGKPVSFTQEQLDAVITERLKRQKSQFADYDELKARAGKLDEIEAGAKSELEREREARTKAETAATEAARRASERIAAAELKAALTGIADNPGDIVEDLNLSRYINADGEVDAEAVIKLRDKYTALAKPGTPPPPVKPAGSIDQGNPGGLPVDLRTADPAVVKAELAKLGLRAR